MNYTITLHNKTEYQVTQEELGAILQGNGLIHIRRLGVGISKSAISNYGPSENIKRNLGATGVLHDGTFVVRQFGQWYLQSGDRDEGGRYLNVIDSRHYPEVSYDCVPSPQDYQGMASLPRSERLKLIVGDRGERGTAREGNLDGISVSLGEMNDKGGGKYLTGKTKCDKIDYNKN